MWLWKASHTEPIVCFWRMQGNQSEAGAAFFLLQSPAVEGRESFQGALSLEKWWVTAADNDGAHLGA